ncbi:peptidoglycan recognition protein family protein [Rhodococcus pyridinivorans]
MSKRDEYAREVLRAGRDMGITPRGIVIAFATVSVECDWIMYANRNDPESLNFPHERIGSDANSVGLFQQRAPWWGTVADRMDPYRSAKLFFTELKKLDYNNTSRTPGWYAQAVQRSAYPDRYDKRMTEAQQLYNRIAAEPGGKHRAPEPTAQEVHTVGDPIWLADVLRAEGLTCDIYPGAFNRGKGDFAGIWGVMAHHTGAPAGSNPGPKAIAEHPSLGLASQLHLDRNGKYTLCGVGIAWHAGVGSYPGLPTNDANRLTIGIEAENSGTEGWKPAQYDAYVRGVAAILRKLGHDSSRVIGHKEWGGKAQGKWDPGGIDMDAFRRDVQKHIDKGKAGDAPMSAQEVQEIKDFIVAFCGPIGSDVKDIRQQLTGGRDAGEYPGWEQLGFRTQTDAIAQILRNQVAIAERLEALEKRGQ